MFYSRYGVGGNFVSSSVEFLYCAVIGVLVRDKERSLDGASVGVLAIRMEDVVVEVHVIYVDGVVEGDGHHLWGIHGIQVAGDSRAVCAAKAVGQDAHAQVARGSPVRVLVHV